MFISGDTSGIVALSSIRRLDLLKHVFPQVWLAPKVIKEFVDDGPNWEDARQAQQEYAKAEWLLAWTDPIPLLKGNSTRLGEGEIQAISLAYAQGGCCFTDDRLARRFANKMDVEEIATARILTRCKKLGVIAAVKPLLYQLRDKGNRLTLEVIEKILREEDEI